MERKTWRQRYFSEEQLEQQELIQKFDHEMISYQCNGFPPSWSKIVWRSLIVVIAAIPLQALEGELAIQIMTIFWSVYATMIYLMPHIYIRENGKQISYYKKMKYLPVSETQVKMVRVMYLYDFWKVTFAIAAATQIGMTYLFYREISVWNIIYIAVIYGVLPWLGSLAYIWFTK